mgnify:FL=1
MIKKTIWFIPKPTAADKVIATENKMIIRDSNAAGENDFIEGCDAVCGDVPKRYEHLQKVDAPTRKIAASFRGEELDIEGDAVNPIDHDDVGQKPAVVAKKKEAK